MLKRPAVWLLILISMPASMPAGPALAQSQGGHRAAHRAAHRDAHRGAAVTVGVGPGMGLGIGLGLPTIGPGYFPSSYYFVPLPNSLASGPLRTPENNNAEDVTITTSATGRSQGFSWFYCASTKSYFPYVSECPEAWLRVPPLSS